MPSTEELLRASGMSFTLLRNGWYLENYTEQLAVHLQHGAVLGSGGQGHISAASRADYAQAAAAVLLKDGQAGKVYELGGDHAFNPNDSARAVRTLPRPRRLRPQPCAPRRGRRPQ